MTLTRSPLPSIMPGSYQKKDYKDFLEALDAAFGRAPELAAEESWAKAIVMREYGLATAVTANATLGLGEARLREAIALFQKSIQANPNFARLTLSSA